MCYVWLEKLVEPREDELSRLQSRGFYLVRLKHWSVLSPGEVCNHGDVVLFRVFVFITREPGKGKSSSTSRSDVLPVRFPPARALCREDSSFSRSVPSIVTSRYWSGSSGSVSVCLVRKTWKKHTKNTVFTTSRCLHSTFSSRKDGLIEAWTHWSQRGDSQALKWFSIIVQICS